MQCRLDKVLLAVAVHGEGHTLELQLARRIHYNLLMCNYIVSYLYTWKTTMAG